MNKKKLQSWFWWGMILSLFIVCSLWTPNNPNIVEFEHRFEPDYIIADEPTSALDSKNKINIIKLIKNRRQVSGTLLISHDLDMLNDLCDEIYFMDKGQVTGYKKLSELMKRMDSKWLDEWMKQINEGGEQKWIWKEF